MNPAVVYVGVDVSKDGLDVHLPGARPREYPNTAAGHRRLIGWLKRRSYRVQVVCEPSGGYQRGVVTALQGAGIAVCEVNAAKVRFFAQAEGQLAKTDPIDAQLLCRYGERMQPEPTEPLNATRRALQEMVRRRNQLRDSCTAEKNRIASWQDAGVRRSLRRMITLLQKEIRRIETRIEQIVASDPILEDLICRLSRVQGIGRRTATALVATMPELGKLTRNEAAALAGLAPYNHDSGRHQGSRRIRGGRPEVRCAIYMPALVASRYNPVLRPMYLRLLAAGKPTKLALTALMRKLIALCNRIAADPSFCPA